MSKTEYIAWCGYEPYAPSDKDWLEKIPENERQDFVDSIAFSDCRISGGGHEIKTVMSINGKVAVIEVCAARKKYRSWQCVKEDAHIVDLKKMDKDFYEPLLLKAERTGESVYTILENSIDMAMREGYFSEWYESQ